MHHALERKRATLLATQEHQEEGGHEDKFIRSNPVQLEARKAFLGIQKPASQRRQLGWGHIM